MTKYTINFTFRLSKELNKKLKNLAQKWKMERSDVIRKLIEDIKTY